MGLADAWVMPFVEENSEAEEGKDRGYPCRHAKRPDELEHEISSQRARVLQVVEHPARRRLTTNDEAVEWFVERLSVSADVRHRRVQVRRRRAVLYLAVLHAATPDDPSEYSAGDERVASRFELAEVRTGHQTQGVGVLTRMGDRFSEWGNGNGLRSLIPTLLTAVMGTRFAFDMIGVTRTSAADPTASS